MSDRRRRKSLSIFRPPLQPLTPIEDEPSGGAPGALKKRRPTSFNKNEPSASGSSSPIASSTNIERQGSRGSLNRMFSSGRQRNLQKAGRPSSLLGSLRSVSSYYDDDEDQAQSASSPSSLRSVATIPDVAAGMLIHHGPLPEVGTVFRKRCPYLVLTDNHLIRFKSQDRASEMFPSIPGSSPAQTQRNTRHSRLSSSSSLHDTQTPSSSENYYSIPLIHAVAVYQLDDGQPYFSIEVAFHNESTNYASTMTLQIQDPEESNTWLNSIRNTASKARMVTSAPFSQGLVEYTARTLEQEQDYKPDHFHMFKTVQRANRSGKRSSTDDLSKLTSKICILAIGMYKVHLVPLPKNSRTSSSTSLSDTSGATHGILTLASVNTQSVDDSFQLLFRQPFQPSSALHLAALCADEIAIWLRQAAEFLRPEWAEVPFVWTVPETLNEQLLPVPVEQDEHRAFERTLIAYCSAYEIDTSNIRYSVDDDCEDAPCFTLLAPVKLGRPKYSTMELLAVFRALRYNETFRSISFSGISLDTVQGLCDHHGWEHTPWTTRSGDPVDLQDQQKASVLIQEIRALALKSRRLRRLDFGYCLNRRPSNADGAADNGCGICEALFPLCVKQYTNVDWVILNGIILSNSDVDYLYAAAIERLCHFRAIEIGFCGLTDRSLEAILQALSHQGATLEAIDFSGNLARLEPLEMQQYLMELPLVRTIAFSRIHRTSGREPLLELDTLMRWRLQELDLSHSTLNAETVLALAKYLREPQSNLLHHICLNQCGLTGATVDHLLQAMNHSGIRKLHLELSENYLEQEPNKLITAIQQSLTPTHMTVRMLEFREETNFRNFIQAWTANSSTTHLDISKVCLPMEPSQETLQALEHMLSENRVMEYLDIAGEEAHLEVANYGPGLANALKGLDKNRTLRVLHIEHQRLGLPGADRLAGILQKNPPLQELHCAGNGFTLQAFTVIIRSLYENTNLLYLPAMDEDRAVAMGKINKEMRDYDVTSSIRHLAKPTRATKAIVKRSIGIAMPGQRQFSGWQNEPISFTQRPMTEEEKGASKGSLADAWNRQLAVLDGFLQRNYRLLMGIPVEGLASAENQRPAKSSLELTAEWLGSNDATPMVEEDRQLGMGLPLTTGVDGTGALGVDEELDGALMMTKKLDLDG
ncbi:MAG: hypothetical protein Q9183_001704 [Haloplaca sp. 2 TL-2023]